MIKSMTGFGREEIVDDKRKVSVEMKAVNHRYCDINIRLPRQYSMLENNIRTLVKKYVNRGKLDIFITYEDYIEKDKSVKYNKKIAEDYYNAICSISKQFELENDVKATHISRYPEVFVIQQDKVDQDKVWNIISSIVEKATVKLVETRETEGKLLVNDLTNKLEGMVKSLDRVKERAPLVVLEYKEKLKQRLNELMEKQVVDEARIAMEVSIFADKSCIDEEIVRLESHIKHMTATLLNAEEGIGRKLDFIAQEMNREANTILSKANDLHISNDAIELKTEIEKIREQIQNIE